MAWIKVQQELKDHYKTRRLARMLKIPVTDAMGRLLTLWCWSMKFAPDGDLSCYDAEDIAAIVMWEGDPDTLLDAFVNCGGENASGFIDRSDDGGMCLHDWEENCDTEYQKKAGDAKRQQKVRARRSASREAHAEVTAEERDGRTMSQPESKSEIKDTPVGAAVAASPQAQIERCGLAETPYAFKQAAEYLLLKTGRKRLTEAEISALRTLDAQHYPARVMAEIDKAAERFTRKGRPLSSLSFEYIAESLKHQASRPQMHNAGQGQTPASFGGVETPGITDEEFSRLEAKFSGSVGEEVPS
jgi:hypothetical protein